MRPYPTMSLEQIFALPVASGFLHRRHDPVGVDHQPVHAPRLYGAGPLGINAGTDDPHLGEGSIWQWRLAAWPDRTRHYGRRGRPIVTLTNQSSALRHAVADLGQSPREFYELVPFGSTQRSATRTCSAATGTMTTGTATATKRRRPIPGQRFPSSCAGPRRDPPRPVTDNLRGEISGQARR